MPTESNFIATIKDADQSERDWHPPLARVDVFEPRLVFADWLEKCGDLRSELIRVQCEIERLMEKAEARSDHHDFARESAFLRLHAGGLLAREQELIAGMPIHLEITGDWPGAEITFRRGFVNELKCPDVDYIDSLWGKMPLLRRVTLTKRPRAIDCGAGVLKRRFSFDSEWQS